MPFVCNLEGILGDSLPVQQTLPHIDPRRMVLDSFVRHSYRYAHTFQVPESTCPKNSLNPPFHVKFWNIEQFGTFPVGFPPIVKNDKSNIFVKTIGAHSTTSNYYMGYGTRKIHIILYDVDERHYSCNLEIIKKKIQTVNFFDSPLYTVLVDTVANDDELDCRILDFCLTMFLISRLFFIAMTSGEISMIDGERVLRDVAGVVSETQITWIHFMYGLNYESKQVYLPQFVPLACPLATD